jgi:hypothetical protein
LVTNLIIYKSDIETNEFINEPLHFRSHKITSFNEKKITPFLLLLVIYKHNIKDLYIQIIKLPFEYLSQNLSQLLTVPTNLAFGFKKNEELFTFNYVAKKIKFLGYLGILTIESDLLYIVKIYEEVCINTFLGPRP